MACKYGCTDCIADDCGCGGGDDVDKTIEKPIEEILAPPPPPPERGCGCGGRGVEGLCKVQTGDSGLGAYLKVRDLNADRCASGHLGDFREDRSPRPAIEVGLRILF